MHTTEINNCVQASSLLSKIYAFVNKIDNIYTVTIFLFFAIITGECFVRVPIDCWYTYNLLKF